MPEARHGDTPLDVTLLICSRDRPVLLADTVRSVLAGAVVPREILVVDQSQGEQRPLSGLETRGCTIRHLYSQSVGASRARNIGLREGACDVVVLLDDDMFVDEAWLHTLVGALADGDESTIATGRVLPAPPEIPGASVPPAGLVTSEKAAVFRGRQPLDVLPAANVALHRGVALAVGGFDDRLGAGARYGAAEDNDLGLRLLDAGCEIRFVPAAVVFHRAWRSRSDRLRLRWAYGRGKGAFYAKYMTLADPYARTRFRSDVGRRMRRVVASSVRSPATSAAEAVSLLATVAGALEWTARERLVRPRRRRGTSAGRP